MARLPGFSGVDANGAGGPGLGAALGSHSIALLPIHDAIHLPQASEPQADFTIAGDVALSTR